MPKVSIIVPCWNVEKYLDRCVNSLVNQTLRDIEIILVDDESPDHVPEMCDGWAEKDSRIKVIHKKNGGLGMACNSGIEVATGEFIAFCDSDDWVELNMYEEMYNEAVSHSADAVYSGIQRINDSGIITPLNCSNSVEIYENRSQIEGFMMDMVASKVEYSCERRIQMSAKTVLYSGDLIRQNNIRFVSEREYMSEDLLFNLDFLKHAQKIVNLPKVFYYYYDNTSSLTTRLRTDRIERYKHLVSVMRDRYKGLKSYTEFCQRLNRMFIGYNRHDTILYFKSDTSFKHKKSFFSTVYNDPFWSNVWSTYPVMKMPIKHGIFALAQKYNLFSIAFLISKI